jgi:Ni,Fe-hydrogenase maturation factor
MRKTLIIGYGNFDRQDDGVAWHILAGLARKLGREIPATPEDEFPQTGESPDLVFSLQLVPELSETLAGYERVCFVDTHTGNVPNDLNKVEVAAEYQSSPFTHHMTPGTLMSLTTTLFNQTPAAILVSVRGYEFGFTRALSARTSALALQAVDLIWAWLNTPDN